MNFKSLKPGQSVKQLLFVLPLIGICLGLFQNCSQNQFALNSSVGTTNPNQSFSASTPSVILNQDIPALLNQSSLTAAFSIADDTNHAVKSVTCELDGPGTQIVKDCASLSVTFSGLADGDYSLTVMLDSTVVALQPKTSGDLFTLKKVFRKDTTAPKLSVSSAPSLNTSLTSAQFIFTAMDNLSGVQSVSCSLDSAAFVACASGTSFSVTLGSHTYQIKATDKAGNASTVYSYTWNVTNSSLASITLNSNLTSPTNSSSIIFTFSSSASGSTYQCSTDNGTYAACTSPKTVITTAGNHSFSVKGLDSSGTASSVSSFSWVVDQTAPTLPSLLSSVVSPSKVSQVSYSFSSTDANGVASYQCSQDGTNYAACTSPKVYTFTDGIKSFYVKAVDLAGNVSTAAKLDVVIDTTLPVVLIGSSPSTTDLSGSIAFSVTESGSGLAQVQCSLDSAAFSTCTSPASYTVALGAHTFRVQATDLAGNASTITTASWTVTTTQTPPPPSSGSPLVLYTDALTGPISGGENNLGSYLSIYGKNFGSDLSAVKVYIGNAEVANYRYLGLSKIASKFGVQQITVQVGGLGGAPLGAALPVKVVVGGVSSNTDNIFTPCSGRILFVSLTGNDSTAVVNDINHPWRHLQVFTGSNNTLSPSAYYSMQAGDHIVIRGGDWTDSITTVSAGWADWLRFAGIGTNNGQERNGTEKAWIHFTAYPGPINGNAIEDVHHTGQPNMGAAFAGPQRSASGTTGNYISISNLRLDVAGGASRDAAPINFQAVQGPWRVVNNDLGPWVAGNSAVLNAGAIAGHGQGHKLLGNHIHNIEGLQSGDQQLQNHGIYADTSAQNWEVAYNYMHDLVGGSGIQFNDNCDGGNCAGSYPLPNNQGIWPGFVGIRIHHNWIETTAKYGINFNDQFSVKDGTYEAQVWNNVIIGTHLPPIRINSTQPHQSLSFFYNTLYDCMTTNSGSGNAYVNNEAWGDGPSYVVQNLFANNIFAFGPRTVAGTIYINYGTVGVLNGVNYNGNTTTYKATNNLYFSNTQSNPQSLATMADPGGVIGDPLFNNAAASDLTLQSTSPAVHRGLAGQIVGNNITNDFFLKMRDTATPDIGAFQH